VKTRLAKSAASFFVKRAAVGLIRLRPADQLAISLLRPIYQTYSTGDEISANSECANCILSHGRVHPTTETVPKIVPKLSRCRSIFAAATRGSFLHPGVVPPDKPNQFFILTRALAGEIVDGELKRNAQRTRRALDCGLTGIGRDKTRRWKPQSIRGRRERSGSQSIRQHETTHSELNARIESGYTSSGLLSFLIYVSVLFFIS
jgi:hypothetical protein